MPELTQPKESKINVSQFIEEINENICIENLMRPFSFNLKQLELTKHFSSAFDEKKDNFLILHIKVQLFCGAEPFSSPKILKWKGGSGDLNPLIMRKICFGLQYKTLPLFSSILFKVKLLKYSKTYDLLRHSTIAWANFRLFDHNRRLKTGKINFNLGYA